MSNASSHRAVSFAAAVVVAAGVWLYRYYSRRADIRRRMEAVGAVKLAPEIPAYLPFGIDRLYGVLKNSKQPFERDAALIQEYGKTFGSNMMGRLRIFVYDPIDIQHFLAKNWMNYDKGEVSRTIAQSFLGDGIFNSPNGPQWKHHRNTAKPHFAKLELGQMVPVFLKHSKNVLALLDRQANTGAVVDIQDIMFRFTLDSVGEILFNHNIDSLNKVSTAFGKAFDRVQQLVRVRGLLYPLSMYIPNPEYDACIKILDDFAGELVDEALNDKNLDARGDLLAEYVKEKENPHSRSYLIDVIKNMMIAGRDTTAALLTWTIFELAQHPEVTAKLIQEINSVFGERRNGDNDDKEEEQVITQEKLQEMKYMKKVLNETLRLHPSVPTNNRTSVEDDVLPSSGTFVPAGTLMIYRPYTLGRLEEYFGPQPLAFNPDRWDTIQPGFAFAAFHAGPRICLGQNQAYLEAKTLLTMLLRNGFEFQLAVPAESVMYRVMIILTVDGGLPVRISRKK